MKALFLTIFFLHSLLLAQTNSLDKITIQFQWKYQFQFAGFIMAKELGYYEESGLDVTFLESQNTVNILEKLHNGELDFAMSNSNIAIKDNKLLDVTLIATYFQRSPLVLVTQKEINSVLDLKGKKIMLGLNDYHNSSLASLLYFYNINRSNATIIEPTYDVQTFIDKKVDATTVFTSNELYDLKKRNIAFNIIDPVEHGFSTNANSLFTSYEKIKNNPEQVNAFLSATNKGWAYAINNIEKTADIIQTKYAKEKTLEKLIFEGKATRELMLLSLYDIGHINKAFVYQEYKRFLKNNKLDKSQTPQKLVLNNSQLQEWLKQKYIKESQQTQERMFVVFLIILLIIILIWSFKMRNEIARRKEAETKLIHLAHHDTLTGLSNRALFLDRLSQAIKNANRRKEKFALLFIDLDYFKEVNDAYGHDVGDSYLKKVAQILENNIRQTDSVSRIGGDEFTMILNNFSSHTDIDTTLSNIMDLFKEPVIIDSQEFFISLSIGVALYPQDGDTADTLIKNADTAMYTAKKDGRNNYKFHSKGL